VKAHALIEAGYDSRFNVQGGAYDSVFFQNANHSVRVTDEFMRAVVEDSEWMTRAVTDRRPMQTFKARELMRAMAEAAWQCGDPGLQYDSTTNDWHTCPASGRINASNPCVTGDTLVATSEGWRRIDALAGSSAQVVGADGELHPVSKIFSTGTKPVYRLRSRAGYEVRSPPIMVWTEEGRRRRSDPRVGEHLTLRTEFGDELARGTARSGNRRRGRRRLSVPFPTNAESGDRHARHGRR
jgi:ribonucleoside-diphosphate reductase alpha chain